MNSQIKIQLRPNNQLTVTVGNWKKKEIIPSQSIQKDFDKISDESRAFEMEKLYKHRVIEDIRKKYSKPIDRTKLDIIKKSQRKPKKPLGSKNKPKNFTRHSGQKVRESGAIIDIECDGQTRFAHEVTLTLPANNNQAFFALAAYSGYAINRLFQPIRRKYGEMCLWFFVWEYQKRGALHLHICVYHPDECEGLYISASLIEQWNKVLADIGELSGVDMFAPKQGRKRAMPFQYQHHTAPIKKAVGSYFSKYAGKEESKNNWYCEAYPVSRFWGSSYSIKRKIKEMSREYSFDYFGYEEESADKLESIVENVVEKLLIVSSSSYKFSISIKRNHRINHYKNGRKVINTYADNTLAEGERFTFYFEQLLYEKAIELLENECSSF